MKFPGNYIKELFIHRRTLLWMVGVVLLFLLGFAYPLGIPAGQFLLALIMLVSIFDITLLFKAWTPISIKRIHEEKLSNGDFNPLIARIKGTFDFSPVITLIDEFPVQLQLRNERINLGKCSPVFERDVVYEIRPTQRGNYSFGDFRCLVRTPLGLFIRRITIEASEVVPVYPSYIQLRKYSYFAISNRLEEAGLKRVRTLGRSNEFEQIREYVRGDDFRLINWKATARKNDLMVNQYQEEKSQNIYCLIDKGRQMHMPFDGLSLMDYAINTSLVLLGVALSRGDRAGLVTFSDKLGSFIPAHGKPSYMQVIASSLYNQQLRTQETDFLRLYKSTKRLIKKRSLLIMFSNFESVVNIESELKYLKAMASNHLLCIIIFENTEVRPLIEKVTSHPKEAYTQAIAEKYEYDKRQILKELTRRGIYCILTQPSDLTVNTINKYIEFKARGAI